MDNFKERRRAPRYDCSFKVDYSSNGIASVCGNTVADNVSKLGICIAVSRLVRKGNTLELKIRPTPTGSSIHAIGKVRWTRPSPADPLYTVNAGIEFSQIENIDADRLINSCR